jgi:hypothetical protein
MTRFAGSESLPSFLPIDRYTRLHLSASGSLGHRFPTFPVDCFHDLRYYYQLRLPTVRLTTVQSSLSSYDTLYCLSFFVTHFKTSSAERGFSIGARRFSIGYSIPDRTRRQLALPSSRATPMNTRPSLRPRW